jgi:hypothetical protein
MKYLKYQIDGKKAATTTNGAVSSPKGKIKRSADKREVAPINSPVHWACYNGHAQILWVLLKFGYLATDIDSCGNNALHLAAGNTPLSK